MTARLLRWMDEHPPTDTDIENARRDAPANRMEAAL